MATKDTQKPGGGGGVGLGVSRFATDGPNPFYGGPLDPRHRDPAALVLETDSSKVEAKPMEGTFQRTKRITENDQKITFHLDEISCFVSGLVTKNGVPLTQKKPVSRAVANLSITLDKVLVFGNSNVQVADLGYTLENDDILHELSATGGDVRKGEPAFEYAINHGGAKRGKEESRAETELPDTTSKQNNGDESMPGVSDVATKASSFQTNGATGHTQNAAATRGPQVPENFSTITSSKPIPWPTPAQSRELIEKANSITPNSRSVVITGLPNGFKIAELLKLIKPTRNTLVVEVKMTKGYTGLLQFAYHEGARDFMRQFPDGFIPLPYTELELGDMEWRALPAFFGEFVPLRQDYAEGINTLNATRFVRVTGRRPTTIKEASSNWTFKDYQKALGDQIPIYDGTVRPAKHGEAAEFQFVNLRHALNAYAVFSKMDGFGDATVDFMQDPHVLT